MVRGDALREALAWLRRIQWKRVAHGWECRGCGTVCVDSPGLLDETTSRNGHACAFTRTVEEAEREVRA